MAALANGVDAGMLGLSWINLVWPMVAAASLTLAGIHLVIWCRQRSQHANVLFALTAVSVALISMFELALMRARTPDEYGDLVRWAHVPIAVLVVGLVGFVLVHFRAGSMPLAVAACLSRIACLAPNFLSGANLNFHSIAELRTLPVWGGDAISVPAGALPSPWMALGHASVLLLVLFIASAIVQVWRRGPSPDRRRVLVVGGGMVLFVLFSGEWTWAVVHGEVRGPLAFSPAFLFVLLGMGYELGGDLLRAGQLARHLAAAELRLHETRRRMDQAVHAADVGLWNWNMAGGRSWFSDHALRLLGCSPGEAFDMARLLERVHPEDRHRFDDALRDALNADGAYMCEYRILLPDDTTRWLVARGQAESGDGRAVTRIDGVLVDITERKHAEERFRLVVEKAPLAMLMTDPEGRIALANQQAEALFGYSRAELAGMPVERIVPARFRRVHHADRTRFMAAQRAIGNGRDMYGLHKDGARIPIDVALNPIPMESGPFVLVSVMDLRERIRMEREIALQRDELAHLSRLALLAELSGSLAHELNQPLTAILANAQAAVRFLAHAPPNLEEVRDALANIVDSDKRAGEVIRRLRALLRKELSDYGSLDVNEVVLDVLRIIRSDLLNRSVEVVLDLAEGMPRVHGDKVQLQQVLLNLIMNASDAMNDLAHGRELSVVTVLAADNRVTVSVSDIGKGIPDGDTERIFVPFVTSKREGLGLGLAVCRTIINAHAGTLWATNNAGPGATLAFSLPASDHPGSDGGAQDGRGLGPAPT
ncbi:MULTISPECIES: PAS domain S-box protein [unclassified Luteimonas]